MALFMDEHNVGQVNATDVAGAHMKDLAVQAKHCVSYQRYWVDEAGGKIYCLVEAPTADAAIAAHREAHGLLADAIHPVVEGA